MDRVSVIMSVYNTPTAFIEKAVRSILNQTYRFFEFIIYDDGSNLETKTYLEKIAKIDERIILIACDDNHGLAYALNRCLEVASGTYIARMDSDDYCDPDRLRKQIDYLVENSLDVVGCNMRLFDDNGIYGFINYNALIYSKDFLYNSPISHPTIVAKRSAFDAVNGYCDEKWCVRNEDYNLFMRMQARGFRLGNISEYLYFFREDSNAASRRKFKYRVNEYKVRKNGFHLLKLYPKGFFYKWKPILIGLIPRRIYVSLKRKRNRHA